MFERAHGRPADALRPVTIEPGFARQAEGSALITVGNTRVVCAPASSATCRASCAAPAPAG